MTEAKKNLKAYLPERIPGSNKVTPLGASRSVRVEADGWYGNDTRDAHLAALEELELAIDTVPEKPCPAQTSLVKRLDQRHPQVNLF